MLLLGNGPCRLASSNWEPQAGHAGASESDSDSLEHPTQTNRAMRPEAEPPIYRLELICGGLAVRNQFAMAGPSPPEVKPQRGRRATDARTVAAAAVFTAFVAAATSVFSVYIPATTGYFNVGEIMVYTCALLMGPYVGAFAGGVGSMISDLSLGYPYYAPGTLMIKGLEGLIVGYLGTKTFSKVSRNGWRWIAVVFGLLLSVTLAYVGSVYLAGTFSITLGGAWGIPGFAFDLGVPGPAWFVLAALAFAAIVVAAMRLELKSGQSVMAVLLGGCEMVAGYYLYESFILRLVAPASVVATLAPAAEVPFNVAQALIGLLVAIPLVRAIRRVTRGRLLPGAQASAPNGG